MRLSFFPLTADVKTLVQNRTALNDHEIVSIISFREDEGRLKEIEADTNILCTSSVEEGLQETDQLVLQYPHKEPQWQKYYDCIAYALQHKIEICGSTALIESLPEGKYRPLVQPLQNAQNVVRKFSDDKLLAVETPIIAVVGLGENCGKFECELELKQYIERRGYRCLAFSSNTLGEYAGMELLPDFLFDDALAFPEKVRRFNRYVYARCSSKRSDVVVLGIPGGVIPLSEVEANHFSEIPMVLSLALSIDAGILAVYHSNEPMDFLYPLAERSQQKINVPINAFYMSRQMTEMDPESKTMQFMFLSDEYIKQHRAAVTDREHIAAVLQDNTVVYENMIRGLQENLETV